MTFDELQSAYRQRWDVFLLIHNRVAASRKMRLTDAEYAIGGLPVVIAYNYDALAEKIDAQEAICSPPKTTPTTQTPPVRRAWQHT
ncbi:hypothetical protein [Nonomuraea zeae]|uniref:hypothetical protein n=1 Tax=Nonomuraea zeae TaxID=1642303 RepID=UPI003620974E